MDDVESEHNKEGDDVDPEVMREKTMFTFKVVRRCAEPERSEEMDNVESERS